mgnify:CR=1 FL=1
MGLIMTKIKLLGILFFSFFNLNAAESQQPLISFCLDSKACVCRLFVDGREVTYMSFAIDNNVAWVESLETYEEEMRRKGYAKKVLDLFERWVKVRFPEVTCIQLFSNQVNRGFYKRGGFKECSYDDSDADQQKEWHRPGQSDLDHECFVLCTKQLHK